MFIAGILLTGSTIEEDIHETTTNDNNSTQQKQQEETKKKNKSSIFDNLKKCFTSRSLSSIIASLLIFSWMYRATSYSNMGSYYEDMYKVEAHARGYIQSYQRILSFVVQSILIGPVLKRAGGERRAVIIAAGLLAIATFCEARGDFILFLSALSPTIALSTTMMSVSLRSLLTQIAPEDAIFSIFAALDVLQNATAVTVPFYRTFLFQVLGGGANKDTAMEGDPDPVHWVITSGIHWAVASLVMAYLLRPDQKQIQQPNLSSGSRTARIKRV
jgi:hypothetical protein